MVAVAVAVEVAVARGSGGRAAAGVAAGAGAEETKLNEEKQPKLVPALRVERVERYYPMFT